MVVMSNTRVSSVALRCFVWLLAVGPALWYSMFWAFVLRARLALGRWPVPYDPDPKDLGFTVHHLAIVLGMPVAVTGPLTLLLMTMLLSRDTKAAGGRPALALAIVLQALLFTIARHDPGHFMYWFAD